MIFTLDELAAFICVFVRAGVVLMFVPVFSGRVVPMRMRISLAFFIAYLCSDFVPLANFHYHVLGLIFSLINELLTGFLIAIGARMLFFTLEFSGQIIANELGFTMSSSFNPTTESSLSMVSQLLFYFSAVVFFIIGAHLEILKAFVYSFQIIASGGSFLNHFDLIALIKISSSLFITGLQIAAPILAINFFVNLVFAILGKTVPRMNVFMASFSVRIAAGLLILVSSLNLLSYTVFDEARDSSNKAIDLFKQ